MTRRARSALAGAAGGALVVALLILGYHRDEERGGAQLGSLSDGARPPIAGTDRRAGTLPIADGAQPREISGARDRLSRSLVGSDVDGALPVDAEGHLIPGPDVLATFDYFLAASGEEPPEVLQRRIRDHIRASLDEPAASEAEALLADYLALRGRLRELTLEGDVPHDLERRLQWVRELRREIFGVDLAAELFGEQEEMLRIDLERRRVALDATLDPAERAARIEALDEELPERVREARHSAGAPAEIRRQVEALRATGASDREVFVARERAFGSEAAERLAALDARRADWRSRLDAYRVERNALLAAANAGGRGEGARESDLEDLRRTHFASDELARVRALDRLAPQGAEPAGGSTAE